MYKRGRKKISGKIIVSFTIIISLILSCVFMRFNFNLSGFFLKDGVLSIDRFFSSFFHVHGDYDELVSENEMLRHEIDKYKELESRNVELVNEVNKLKEVININELLSDSFYVNGTVVNRNFDFWNDKLFIDVGSSSGVMNRMAVLSNGTLIGITDDVSPSNSSVILLCNYKFPMNISVKIDIDGKYVYGILNNYNSESKSFSVIGVVDNISIPEGSLVYTTGFGNVFPSGLLVGHVTSLETDNFDLSKVVVVSPDINFDDISYVTVVGRKDK